MSTDLVGRSLLRDTDLTKAEFLSLIDLADELRAERRSGAEKPRLVGRSVALIFEKTSTRTRVSFQLAAGEQGAQVLYLGPGETQLGEKESIADTARFFGRLFDGIEYRGGAQDNVERLGAHAGVPVWNGLTDRWHPTQMLADVLTIRDHTRRPLEEVVLCYLGDGRNNTAHSLLVTGAQLGLDLRVAAPGALFPDQEVRGEAERLALASGARLTITSDVAEAVSGADFLYTDVWLSMGEPAEAWDERIDLLLGFQVNRDLLESTGNSEVKFLHCLPAFHDEETGAMARIAERRGLACLEVTDEVFQSPASIVFDQAENRFHTIKALMVATLGG